MSTEDPRGDWGEWTPGKGVERIRTEMPGVMPDLTEEDYTAAEAIIAAASKPAPNPLAHLPAMLEDARAYCLARFNYEPGAYISEEARQQHIDNDARSTTTDTCFTMPWNAGYARGISEGQRLRTEKLDALTRGAYEDGRGDGLSEGRRRATEGWEREWGGRWMQDAVEPTNDLYLCSSETDARALEERSGGYRRAESRLVGPWEPAEQPESRVRTGYQCAIGGEACPGHSSKWLMCDPATRTAGEVKIRPRMTDGCGPEHTYRDECELRPEGSDRGE